MASLDLIPLLNSKLSLFVLGGLLGGLLTHLRRRVRTLEYTVHHDRVAIAADDNVFGAVRVTWQGHDVTNLFTSTVTVHNTTQNDYENLKLTAYTADDTILLTQFTQVPGTSYILRFSAEFEAQLNIPDGQQPTEQQLETYRHRREYVVPVLNRGQTAVIRFLTTVPPGRNGPSVWVDMLHAGLRITYRPNIPHVHGVPLRYALWAGLVASVAALVFSGLFVANVWLAASLCLLVGLAAQLVGAHIYRFFRFLWRLTVR